MHRIKTKSARYHLLSLGFASVPVSLERQILRTRSSSQRLAFDSTDSCSPLKQKLPVRSGLRSSEVPQPKVLRRFARSRTIGTLGQLTAPSLLSISASCSPATTTTTASILARLRWSLLTAGVRPVLFCDDLELKVLAWVKRKEPQPEGCRPPLPHDQGRHRRLGQSGFAAGMEATVRFSSRRPRDCES